MEEDDSDKMDRKSKRKIDHIIDLDKVDSSTKKISQRNRNTVHQGSSSSVLENQSAPADLPENTNVSISTTVAEAGVWPPPQPQVEELGTSSYSDRGSGAPALGGLNRTVALLPPHFLGKVSSSPNQEPRNLHKCVFCSTMSYNFWWLHQHQMSHVDGVDQSEQNQNPTQRSTTNPTQYNNPSARYNTPMNMNTTLTSPYFSQRELGFWFDSSQIQVPQTGFQSQINSNFNLRPIYGGGGCSRTEGFHEVTDVHNFSGIQDLGGRSTYWRLATATSSLSLSETREEEINDGSIDLLSGVGTSNSLENRERDGDEDQDHDMNEEEDGALIDLSLQIGRKPPN
ncbi:unnamed protein product [Lactuca saligna]|uniref:Uncharacterized protein n=1 Tax=Lactuca saligna TaxID=75948 RepID=A0AA35ZFR2_LACSI|nr:unnamed protein product [Lactuca saligna]